MILPVALISACFLISASLGSEESCYLSEEQEDQCASVCYPIVKPLLRYFEKSNEKEFQLLKSKTDYSDLQQRYSDLQSEGLQKYAQISKCQGDYSDLVKSHLELENKYAKVLNELKDSEVKYERLFSKQQKGENLKALIMEKHEEIKQLKEQISDLKKPSELATLTNQFREDIAKLGGIVKTQEINENNRKNSNNKTEEVLTIPLPIISRRPQKHNPQIFVHETQKKPSA
ncbi:uncharacterized membrane protein YttA-like [Drosophila bipectinata]|uniref:uncharacterized membrane protein YttA-like n=1 Tax=Drosophila bipectinata TaxID=42026 RepID=UPI0038B367D6